MKRIGSRYKAKLLETFTGTPEEVTARYKTLLCNLGQVSTEAIRKREILGRHTAARVATATHRFAYPPEEASILKSQPEEGHSGQFDRTIESKVAAVSMLAGMGVGIELDTIVEPPFVRVWDITSLPHISIAPELVAAIAPPEQESY